MKRYQISILFPVCSHEEWILILMGRKSGSAFSVVSEFSVYAKSVEETLRNVFSLSNEGGMDLPRSVCVGNVVEVDGVPYVCAPNGWQQM